MEFADRELKCATCGKPFVFSADEQQLFYVKGFIYPPEHCKKCKGTNFMEGLKRMSVVANVLRKLQYRSSLPARSLSFALTAFSGPNERSC